MHWQDKLRYWLTTNGVVGKLIAVNVLVFILIYLLKTLSFFMQWPEDSWLSWLVFPKEISVYLSRPWTIVSYAFLHADFWHLLSNMIILYFSGQLFLTFYSEKRLLSYYFLGAILGALVYMLSFNFFPVFASIEKSYLLGASAGVMAILIGVATQAPNMQVRLFLLGNIKLWHIAVFFVALDILQLSMSNTGGRLAHLGGAFLGFLYTKQLQQGRNIGAWFEQLLTFISSGFKFPSSQKAPFKKVYKNKAKTKKEVYETAAQKQAKIDHILDKISKSGYDSLSKEEKDYLFNKGGNK